MLRLRSILPAVLSLLAAVPATAAADAAPVAAYGFEDAAAATTAGDASSYGNTGTLVGGAARATGRFGSAISLDGVNDRVRVPDAGSVNLASGMTLEAWVNPAVTTGWRGVVLKERLGDISYGLYSSGSANPGVFAATDGEMGSALAGSSLPLNTWSHLAATYDGTTLRFYLNGVQAASSTASSGPMVPGSGPLSIGGNGIESEWFRGLIDEVRVYDRALSVAEIQGDMATPVGEPASAPPGQPASAVGSWTPPQNWPVVAVHTSMLSNGKVVTWDAFGAAVGSERVWDPATGAFQSTPSGINLFCAGHALLPDGRLFAAGGHELAYVGLRDTKLFNPLTGTWTAGPDMARGRWYPTTTTLADGRILIVSGDGIVDSNNPFFVRPSNTIPEIYDPKTNTISSMPSAGRLMPLYPYMFVAPDGRVVDAGPDQTTAAAGHADRAVVDADEPLAGDRRECRDVPARQDPHERHVDRHRSGRGPRHHEQVRGAGSRPGRARMARRRADEVGADLPHADGAARRRRAVRRRSGPLPGEQPAGQPGAAGRAVEP